ncbi:twin-arginine translocation pathway signal protein [Novosphingobium sp. M1R2S20]|uniref:Twin-arginine translocation pathway signal protein n=1 Tax=Novosphingobium rhizovicinum TaxID=3228928 RepID=A0ABV3RAW4_9SPHN
MTLTVAGAGLTLKILLMAGGAAFADAPAGTAATPPQATVSAQARNQAGKPTSLLVPAEFAVPTLVETSDFKLVPLGPALVRLDFDAYMSSIEHLQKTFSRSTAWPHAGISDADAMRDIEAEEARFRNRKSFAYAVLSPDGMLERGSVYVSPSPVEGYDAVVRMWVTKDEYDAGFDAELHKWVADWIRTDWPFAKVAYPGRTIEWDEWQSMIVANKAAKTR